MKSITLLTVGTRGDVQPFIALGLGLQRSGYAVTVATSERFAEFVRAYGLAFAPLSAEFLDLANTAGGKKALTGKGSLGLLRQAMPLLRRMLDSTWPAIAPATAAIVYHPKVLAGYHLAEKLGIPAFVAFGIPALSPTREFANPLLTTRNLGPTLNRFSYRLFAWASTAPYRSMINQWRREQLDLPPCKDDTLLRGRLVPILYCYSSRVVPTPLDWDSSATVTGYWLLDQAKIWQPPVELVSFLEAGPPPVYVGFGSMPAQDRERTTATVLEALRQTGQRAVLATGAGGLAAPAASRSVLGLEAAPHDWLFPQMSAVVHHGGAGTTAAGLLAGKPSVICPFFGDQPFWGKRVAALGVGPEPIPQARLSVEALAKAIQSAVADDDIQKRARTLGTQLRTEAGMEGALQVIGCFVQPS
jgi:sterol 3beta-glucosyltransferase